MVFVIPTACNGCGDCVSVCPNTAIVLQNNHAFIDQELCQGCEGCVDSCPQGAILTGEPASTGSEVIKIPSIVPSEITAVPEQHHHTTLQNVILPTIGSALLWTGRELVPRLANFALEYLDRRIHFSQSSPTQKIERRRNGLVSTPLQRRGRRRRRRGRN